MAGLEIGYLDFDREIFRRLSKRKDDVDNVCSQIKHELHPFLPTSSIERILREPDYKTRVQKLAKQKARLVQKEGKKWQEIVVEAIMQVHRAHKISDKRFDEIFGHTRLERRLNPIVRRYFKEKDKRYQIQEDSIPIGRSKPDLVLFKEHGRKVVVGERGLVFKKPVYKTQVNRELLAVEAKVDFDELRRYDSQVKDYQTASDKVYLATTTPLILEKGQKELVQELKHNGVGLIHVDMWKRQCEIKLEGRRGTTFDSKAKKELIDKYFG